MKIIITLLSIVLTSVLQFGQSSIVYDNGTEIEVGIGADVCAETITCTGIYSGDGTFCNGPLPVEFISFSAKTDKNNVELSWLTETEVQNLGFEIQKRSANTSLMLSSKNWQKIGFVSGFGNSNIRHQYLFRDKDLNLIFHQYRLKQIDLDGSFEYSNVVEINIGSPIQFELSKNYPNPFNPTTTISFTLPERSIVKLYVYNAIGKKVAELLNHQMMEGYHSVDFDGTNLTSGIYFYRIVTEKYSHTKKMILLK